MRSLTKWASTTTTRRSPSLHCQKEKYIDAHSETVRVIFPFELFIQTIFILSNITPTCFTIRGKKKTHVSTFKTQLELKKKGKELTIIKLEYWTAKKKATLKFILRPTK
jgi:hypothetical protein